MTWPTLLASGVPCSVEMWKILPFAFTRVDLAKKTNKNGIMQWFFTGEFVEKHPPLFQECYLCMSQWIASWLTL